MCDHVKITQARFSIASFQFALCVENRYHLQRDGFGSVDDHIVGNFVIVQKRAGSVVTSSRFVPMRGCLANRRQVARISISTPFCCVAVVFRDEPPNRIKVVASLRR